MIRFAKENTGRGIERIWGELRKVGVFLGRSFLKRVLKPGGAACAPPGEFWREDYLIKLLSVLSTALAQIS